jgi:preprotein translocase subunit YajC
MIVAMIAIFYFVIMRPENKRKKALKEMLTNLSVGDKITTGSGIVGKVVSIDGDLVTFETGEDRVRIQVIKTAIQTVGDPQTAVATK